ncbi:Protein OAC-59 a [Aphelenchoides avenae]|nr:Protein OAC-59 a [Aphelenchus avenae]
MQEDLQQKLLPEPTKVTVALPAKPSHAAKRKDIQGLRAVAITSVLMFHIWPKRFPRGYLGVDVFFVLSGYLMAMILGRNKVMSLDVAEGSDLPWPGCCFECPDLVLCSEGKTQTGCDCAPGEDTTREYMLSGCKEGNVA